MAAAWKADAERLIRAVCPELSDEPVYIVTRDELDQRFDASAGCFAYTSPVLDVQLRPLLERVGRWVGRGFAMVVFEGRIRQHSRGVCSPAAVDRACINTALHELAHHADFCSIRSPLTTVALRPVEVWPESLKPLAIPQAQAVEPGNPIGHGGAFIRAAIHVVFRANEAGYLMELAEIGAAGDVYGLAPIEEYAEQLGDEPARRVSEPLQAVLSDPPPAAYAVFADLDLKKSRRSERHFDECDVDRAVREIRQALALFQPPEADLVR